MTGRSPASARLGLFSRALLAAGFDAALLTHHRNVLYLSGTAQPCNLLVVPGREPVLFARRFGDLARQESWLAQVIDASSFSDVLEKLRQLGLSGGRLGLELDIMPVALYLQAHKRFANFTLADCAPVVLAQRGIKDDEEVEALRRAAQLFEVAHEAVVMHLREGVREHELAAEVIRSLRYAGHAGLVVQRRWDAIATPDVVVSGPNLARISGGPVTVSGVGLSRALPMGASRREIRAGDLVNLDVGLNLDGYHADVARTYVLGEPTDEIITLASAVRSIQDACLEAIGPGTPATEIYAIGVSAAREAGVDDAFQGYGSTRGLYVGHGLGLEIDEPPTLGPADRTVLAAGMVLAVEPKLISPRFGAVNLEDDVLVTANGCELFETVPRTVFSIDSSGAAVPLSISSS